MQMVGLVRLHSYMNQFLLINLFLSLCLSSCSVSLENLNTFIMAFALFLKYYIKILYILIIEFFSAIFTFAPQVNFSLTSPESWTSRRSSTPLLNCLYMQKLSLPSSCTEFLTILPTFVESILSPLPPCHCF